MKRLLLLLTAAMLLSGCIRDPHALSSGEMMVANYAYVVGTLPGHTPGGSLRFIHSDYVSDTILYSRPVDTYFTLTLDGDDDIIKVRPGTYIVEYSAYQGSIVGGTARIGALIIAPGKINYIGTFSVSRERQSYTASGAIYSIAPVVSYQAEAVKAKLKQNYPQLAQDIDSKFVVQPLR